MPCHPHPFHPFFLSLSLFSSCVLLNYLSISFHSFPFLTLAYSLTYFFLFAFHFTLRKSDPLSQLVPIWTVARKTRTT